MKERMYGIDVLRVLVALFVFLFHSRIHLNCNYGIFDAFIKMGAIFMTAFFMLSGFSLYYAYETTFLIHLHELTRFYLKRLFSIFPLYYFAALLFVLLLGEESYMDTIVLAPIEMLGIQSTFTTLFNYSHNGGTWFISCIIICYLFYPFFQEVIKQLEMKWRILLLFFAFFVLIYASYVVSYFSIKSIYTNPFYRGIEFFIGAILASIVLDLKWKKIFNILFTRMMFIFGWCTLFLFVSTGETVRKLAD